MLHRMRGVKVGRNVFIGDDVYLENGVLSDCSLDRKDAFAMVQQHAKTAGIQTRIGCHTSGQPESRFTSSCFLFL